VLFQRENERCVAGINSKRIDKGSFKVNLKNKKDNKLEDLGMIPKEKRKYIKPYFS